MGYRKKRKNSKTKFPFFLHLVLAFAVLSILSGGIYLNKKLLSSQVKAAQTTPIDFYGTQVNFLQLFGQRSIKEISRGLVTPNRAYHAAGTIVDKSSTPNKVYVVDTGNNRILGFNGIGHCQNDTAQQCTLNSDCSGGVSCINDPQKNADIIIGQQDTQGSSCNGDANIGLNANPTASSLCLTAVPNYANNIAEAWFKINIDVDSQGNLYVPDWINNRILKYNQPFSADKTGGKGDTIADFVWGQPDFTHNTRNQGPDYFTVGTPTASSLFIGGGGNTELAATGVSVDHYGNVWVADSFNHRVLRFPPDSQQANLVIGQPDFSTTIAHCEENAPMNSLCAPAVVGLDPDTDELYVADHYPSPFKGRIYVYSGTFSNGMTASRKLQPVETTGNPFQVLGFTFNTYKQGPYANGKLWINEHANKRTVLLDANGTELTAINVKTLNDIGGDSQYGGACGSIENGYKLWSPGGSIGVDSNNNMYFADETFHKLQRYALPYNLQQISGQTCLPDPNGSLMGPYPNNDDHPAAYTLGESGGMVMNGNQLVINDRGTLKAWNDYMTKTIGSNPDVILSGKTQWYQLTGGAVDDLNRWWNYDSNGKLQVWQLPLNSNSTPLASNLKLYWADTQAEIPYSLGAGVTFDKVSRTLYIADYQNNRIFRVSNYNQYQNQLFVDMVLGQPSATSTTCANPPTANNLCYPNNIRFDNVGNLYVAENGYECHGNDRLIMFSAQSLTNATGEFPNVAATKAFVGTLTSKGPCAYNTVNYPGSPISIAFLPNNDMIVGNDGYYGDITVRQLRQLWYYRDPVNTTTPYGYIKLPMGTPAEIVTDSNSNVYIQDHTWNRVWGINLATDPQWIVPLNNASPVPTYTPVPTITSTPTITPIPPTPTRTPTPSPTPKPGDTIAPTVSITSPNNGTKVNKNSNVTIKASAKDNVKVAKVEFYVNGVLTCTDITGAYSCVFKTGSQTNLSYAIYAKAYDTSNNIGMSSTITITTK